MRAKEVMERYESIYPEFTQKLEDALIFFLFQQLIEKKIRTTDNLERFNEDKKKEKGNKDIPQ